MLISSEKLACCVCTSGESHFWKKVDSWNVMKCSLCGLVHMDSVATEAESFLDEAPEGKGLEYWGYPDVFKKYPEVFEYFFEERFQRIKNASPPEGEWLDIGSGFGLWQTFLQKKNIRSSGIEIEKKAQLFCRHEGLDVEHVSIEKFETEKRFACITMCDVLEHVKEPLEVLKKCRDLLIPGGLLYVQVPSVLGLRYPYRDSLGLPHHLWQFSPKHLNELVTKSHLKSLVYWTGVQGVIRHYEEGGPSFFTKVLWKMAMATRRGNRLQLLARKS